MQTNFQKSTLGVLKYSQIYEAKKDYAKKITEKENEKVDNLVNSMKVETNKAVERTEKNINKIEKEKEKNLKKENRDLYKDVNKLEKQIKKNENEIKRGLAMERIKNKKDSLSLTNNLFNDIYNKYKNNL